MEWKTDSLNSNSIMYTCVLCNPSHNKGTYIVDYDENGRLSLYPKWLKVSTILSTKEHFEMVISNDGGDSRFLPSIVTPLTSYPSNF